MLRCAGCGKPITEHQTLAHVGPVPGGVTWHLLCFKLRELTPGKEMN
jgi:hypothetical protein